MSDLSMYVAAITFDVELDGEILDTSHHAVIGF